MATVFGRGYIGTAVANLFLKRDKKVHWYSHQEAVSGVVHDFIIVNCAGYVGIPNVDVCEDHKYECIDGNILWPLRLEKEYSGGTIIHISSGCVYSGYKDGGWTEEDEPNFTGSFYSLTKAIVQKELDLKNNYLLRVRMPFGMDENPRDYLTKLKNYPKLINMVNSMSFLDDIAEVVYFIAKNRPEPGIYNLVNPGEISTKEIVDMASWGWDKYWLKMDEFNSMIRAPRSFCTLNTDKLTKIFLIPEVHKRVFDVLKHREELRT